MKPRRDDPDAIGPTVIRAGESPVFAAAVPDATIIDLDAGGHAPAGWTQRTIIGQALVSADAASPGNLDDAAWPSQDIDRKLADGLLPEGFLPSASPNPIVAAATPVLTMLNRLRSGAARTGSEALAGQIGRAIRAFERRLSDAGIAADTARTATLVLCAMADDIAGNLPGGAPRGWAEHSMLQRFFPSVEPGTSFFEILNRLLADPEAHYDLLELMHNCLSLGFLGQYRSRLARHGGDLDRIRQDVYETLRYFRSRAADEISPRWQGLAITQPRSLARVPFWSIALIAVALVAGSFLLMRALLHAESTAVSNKLLALNPSTPIAIQRSAAPNAVPAAKRDRSAEQFDRLRTALAEDIEAGNLLLETRGDLVVVEINNRSLFDPGKADIKPQFLLLAAKLAAALEQEPGQLQVVGHTDDVKPRKSSAFASNYDLSVARAQAVADALRTGLRDPSRVIVTGKGENEPIADNSTPEGRATNRRVEVMIPRAAPQ